jgi:hypothetical protein
MALDLDRPVVLRGFVAQREITALRNAVEEAYCLFDAGLADLPEHMQTSHVWGGLACTDLAEQWSELAPPLQTVVERIGDACPGARWLKLVSVFRRIEPRTWIYWHTDNDGAGAWEHRPTYNFWLPLQDAVGLGTGYPSLELVVGSDMVMRSEPRRLGYEAQITPEWVEERFSGPAFSRLCPVMVLGDALVFSGDIVHRTQPMPMVAGPRIGAEIRFHVPTVVPGDEA